MTERRAGRTQWACDLQARSDVHPALVALGQITAAVGLDVVAQAQLAAAASVFLEQALRHVTPCHLSVQIVRGPGTRIALTIGELDPQQFPVGEAPRDAVAARAASCADRFESHAGPRGTVLRLSEPLPENHDLQNATAALDRIIQQQTAAPANQVDATAVEISQLRQAVVELTHQERLIAQRMQGLDDELEETNRGVVALYAELDEQAAALRRSEQLYRGLIQSQHDPLVRVTRRGEIVFINEAMAAMLDIAPEPLAHGGLTLLLQIVHPKDRPPFRRLMREVMRPPYDASLECRIWSDQHNEWRWFTWSVYGVRDAGSRVVEFQAAGRDITETRRSLEQQQQRQNELAQVARLITVGELATGLAHELNQPIGAIVNFANGTIRRIERGAFPVDELLLVLRDIAGQGERAGRIIHNLRKFIGYGELQQSLTDLNELIESAVELITPNAVRDGVAVSATLDEHLPAVRVDQVLIEQVLVNLLTNAVDELKRHEGLRELHLRTMRLARGDVCITVDDTGPGLPPGPPEQVFKAFFTTKGKGLGMGLAISRTIVRGHGGELSAEGAPTGGARFTLTLPLGDGT